jgi:hypothetical protein
MTSTMVEYLQGIHTAKEAAAPDENGSGNPKIRHEHFTRADDANTRCTMCSNALCVTARISIPLVLLISLSSYPLSLLIYVTVRLCAMISLRDFARICAAALVRLFRLIY